ncbi:sensor domain-containing diguanylate cyclase [Vibrio parahaemolyticus]|uniref:sensor domain-containing diguanylate cyclase n=1 Tax=Vibrio parahaemolyticus TaxID=670 RepID=UPI0004256580|nr:sensor domain-containing diguanylate cyclase [Vibrio parahaemolyticus]EGR3301137.1 sensor domain-containing diguanylate cyclase [Vibrio parahaemolyticus]EGR3304707.1 sensor domain-containing diguanylate cyclase [Vibrio parahaemolyticus]EGR3320162.1 sensor domain-containing diguanylate cyclase [Vibrio parahaemolyticus]EGR3320891.1 sensor domain-containing diguanylate cyclase [Vibrio parahaemolyticus]KHF08522.1 diguanylate cyclase [Vibrio parahaemolyticus]
MRLERTFDPNDLSTQNMESPICLPIGFVHFLAQSQTLQQVLDTVAEWINRIFESDRTSITLYENSDYLKVYSFSGNKAIPADFLVPIDQAFVGRVFKNQQLIICDDVSQSDELDCVMLTSSGMGTCMDAPLMHGQMCLGTLNVAHHQTHFYTKEQAAQLQCIANWIALNIALHIQIMKMEHLATTDDLTGIPNRREFIRQIEHRLSEFRTQGIKFHVAILDLDNFKKLNDKFGHDAGDKSLIHAANTIKGHLRECDLLARVGGEEFAIVLRSRSSQEAMDTLETIRNALETTTIRYSGRDMTFTASIGVTQVCGLDDSFEPLVKRADLALYKAKETGRNRVEINHSEHQGVSNEQ